MLLLLPERLRPFVTVVLHTGMRRGELLALRWQDVDFATGTIRVRRDKAGDGRWVLLNSVAREALLAVKREQKVLGPHVFCSPEGKFLHNWEREWRPALQTAKIGDFRFHDYRHTFASRLAMAKVDLYTVQRAGGWKTAAMVQRYAHLNPDHMRAAVERLAQNVSESGTGTKTGTEGAGTADVAPREARNPAKDHGAPGRDRTCDPRLRRGRTGLYRVAWHVASPRKIGIRGPTGQDTVTAVCSGIRRQPVGSGVSRGRDTRRWHPRTSAPRSISTEHFQSSQGAQTMCRHRQTSLTIKQMASVEDRG
jgi:hypothetical protein